MFPPLKSRRTGAIGRSSLICESVMAYLCILASVPRDKLTQIRDPSDLRNLASRTTYASHLIAGVPGELHDAMDGGAPLETDTWHPLRGFIFHEPAAVQQLATRLTAFATRAFAADGSLHNHDWFKSEITKVVGIFQHASATGEAIVNHLDLTRTGEKIVRH